MPNIHTNQVTKNGIPATPGRGKINCPESGRMLVPVQGTAGGAYWEYSPLAAALKAGRQTKTSKLE